VPNPTAQDPQLARLFEQHRARLRAVAYRMLGSLTEAEDAVQDTWRALFGRDPRAWKTRVVG
jgi:DNA-directed RNA polymerase specialized sigma24 family protein